MADDQSNPTNWLGPYADTELGRAALRAAERPAFLASAMAEYASEREWTPEKLAYWLRCAPGRLAALGLCRRPNPAAPEFSEQVTQIVVHFQLDYWNLRRLLEDMALPYIQRQSLWHAEAVDFGSSEEWPSGLMGSEDFGQFLDRPQASASRRAQVFRAAAAPEGAAPGAAESPLGAPVAATPDATAQRSWLGRLFAAIRPLFSRKS